MQRQEALERYAERAGLLAQLFDGRPATAQPLLASEAEGLAQLAAGRPVKASPDLGAVAGDAAEVEATAAAWDEAREAAGDSRGDDTAPVSATVAPSASTGHAPAAQTPGQFWLGGAVEGLGGVEALRSLAAAASGDEKAESSSVGDWPTAVVHWDASRGSPRLSGLSADLSLTAEPLPVSLEASGWGGPEDVVPDRQAVLL
ncbi:hypothetical protein F751_6109 [Auxenochlorella protothecoides]|uniref:Uncharacterized protein n=1 Tax=Auxenochlorella protothecoides TaxID=3075 RepID=A0A087SHE9_AUXPR|nr:hypothetical protein F751_6109 [Auxenochlorella protothecoides]KFM25153.1 hypothetical protein F751_6109 [Auxenochlorella protothecoides]